MSGVVLLILILGFVGNLSVALECYTCVGPGAGCQTGFEGNERECISSKSQRCYVSRTELNENVKAFSRSCVDVSACNDGCVEDSVTGYKTNVCTECCDTDLCNTGNSGVLFTPIIHLLIVGTVMALEMSAIMSE
ncbi:ly6/PLAUR domain-containing protein 2-like [Ptychodera flava]|uniref:ly6/PLAUR domain-containing protein 2-like n=1 Tax=Ptychodera flava TaxID=63121 RepID=UPI00396A863D